MNVEYSCFFRARREFDAFLSNSKDRYIYTEVASTKTIDRMTIGNTPLSQ